MGLSASRPRALSAEKLAGRDGGWAGVKDLFDQDMDCFDGESNSKRFDEDVDVSETIAMEPCGATFSVEAAEMKPLRHAMWCESMASGVQACRGNGCKGFE